MECDHSYRRLREFLRLPHLRIGSDHVPLLLRYRRSFLPLYSSRRIALLVADFSAGVLAAAMISGNLAPAFFSLKTRKISARAVPRGARFLDAVFFDRAFNVRSRPTPLIVPISRLNVSFAPHSYACSNACRSD